MKYLQLLILLTVLSCLSNSDVTETNDSSVISGNCSSSPYWKLNICNITCNQCTATNNYLCSSCQANYTLSSDNYCMLNNNTYYYIYNSYLTDIQIPTSDLKSFYNTMNYQQLSTQDVVSICQNATYNFQMIGLFKQEDTIGITMTYTEKISYVSISFNLLLLINNVLLTIYLNGKLYYSLQFTTLSNATAEYYDSIGNNDVKNQNSYLNIPSLTTSSANSIMQLISVDLAITTTELLIEINVGTADSTRFWAISDLVILARQCDTCPTYELTNTISDIGTITLYTTAIVFPLLIFFFCMVKWESYRRKLKHLTKIGGDTETQSHIPLKVVNRVHSTLSQLTKKVQIIKSTTSIRNTNIRETAFLKKINKFD